MLSVLLIGCTDEPVERDPLRAEALSALTTFATLLARSGDSLLAVDARTASRSSDLRVPHGRDSSATSLAPIGIVPLSRQRVKLFAQTGMNFPLRGDARQFLYPVISDAGVEAALLIDRTATGYRTSAIGGHRYITELLVRRHALATAAGVPEDSVFVVRVGALDLEYAAATRGGVPVLALVGGGPSITPGEPARQTFQNLDSIIDRAVNTIDTTMRIGPFSRRVP